MFIYINEVNEMIAIYSDGRPNVLLLVFYNSLRWPTFYKSDKPLEAMILSQMPKKHSFVGLAVKKTALTIKNFSPCLLSDTV